MSDEEISSLFYHFDTDGSGELSISEFANAIFMQIAPDEPGSSDEVE